MAIYAIKNTSDLVSDAFLFNSLKNGKARFGWSYELQHDIKKMDAMPWSEFDRLENEEGIEMYNPWSRSKWLLNVEPGDHFVYIHQPDRDLCTVVKIVGQYSFEKTKTLKDFRHSFDCEFIGTFNRNNQITANLSVSALRPRRGYHRIYEEGTFLSILDKLPQDALSFTSASENIIGDQISAFVSETTETLLGRIKHYFPQKRFEDFIMQILIHRESFGEIRNQRVFRGWGADTGCDIKFDYYNPTLSKFETVIMQLKAYDGKANMEYAVQNLTDYMRKSKEEKVDHALVMTTATEIDIAAYEKAKHLFESEFKIPIHVLYGKSMLSWVLRHGSQLLYGENNSE